jgi:5-methylcytosine-specific restriction endonuclease McrA
VQWLKLDHEWAGCIGPTPMTTIEYRDYLASPEWQATAAAALERADQRCQVCNADRWFSPLEVHHRTYERLGAERPADLIVLCRHCHDLFHAHRKLTH